MKRILTQCYPDGKCKAATFSYDDGRDEDRLLIKLLNQYGLKASIHLNGGLTHHDNRINIDELDLYEGHEISCHSLTHPTLTLVPRELMIHELMEDRKALEAASGYPVVGMSYPNGAWNADVIQAARSCGIVYSRTTVSTNRFKLPEDFMEWHPTCHHRHENVFELIEQFANLGFRARASVLYIWGHSYEFSQNVDFNNWGHFEEICRRVSALKDTWFATNIEIYNYVTALKQLVFSADCSTVVNPTAFDLWIIVDDKPEKIPAGETVRL
jgi:hypothetical protein